MGLKFSANLPLDDVAQMMGKIPAAIKLVIYRAVQRMRGEFDTPEEWPGQSRAEGDGWVNSVRFGNSRGPNRGSSSWRPTAC